MNEQFIILAEKLNNVTSIAESLTPEVIQQTLEYNLYSNIVWLGFFIISTLMFSVLTYKTIKMERTNGFYYHLLFSLLHVL